MTKQQEFRKQTEEAKFEAFALMCKKVTKLEKENTLLGKRCNQLLKDKGKLTDKCKKLEEQLKSYEGYINDIPLVIDPCKMCKNEERKTEEQVEKCRLCCWYYTSSFEIK